MSRCVWVAIADCRRLGGRETTEIYFSPFWRQRNLRSRCLQIQCLVRLSALFANACLAVSSSYGVQNGKLSSLLHGALIPLRGSTFRSQLRPKGRGTTALEIRFQHRMGGGTCSIIAQMFINKHTDNKCHLCFASNRTFLSGVWKGRCIVPSQAGNLPAKSKRNSSSQTGDLSYPDHTGEYWFQPLSRLTGREGLAEWCQLDPNCSQGIYIFSVSWSS